MGGRIGSRRILTGPVRSGHGIRRVPIEVIVKVDDITRIVFSRRCAAS
jgi:hypothetical protein